MIIKFNLLTDDEVGKLTEGVMTLVDAIETNQWDGVRAVLRALGAAIPDEKERGNLTDAATNAITRYAYFRESRDGRSAPAGHGSCAVG